MKRVVDHHKRATALYKAMGRAAKELRAGRSLEAIEILYRSMSLDRETRDTRSQRAKSLALSRLMNEAILQAKENAGKEVVVRPGAQVTHIDGRKFRG